jgi:Bacterial EndoU nuclease
MKNIFALNFLLLTSLSALQAQHLSPKAEKHIFQGEINRQGKAVGCHHIRAINFYKTAQIVEGTRTNGPNGLFKAKVKVKSASGKWVDKISNGGYSTFFPEKWTEEKTKAEIEKAFQNKRQVNGDLYEGKCSEGWIIQFYVNDDETIPTAYPRDWSRNR